MDLYTLDAGFQRSEVVEEFISLIWTERYATAGDFVLNVPDTMWMRTNLAEGTFLSIPNESKEVMLIETVVAKNKFLTIQGFTLSKFLANRMARNTWAEDPTSWPLTGSAGAIAGQLVRDMCMTGHTMDGTTVVPDGALEIIPNLILGPTAAGTSITSAVPFGNVYDDVVSLCALDAVGFTMYPDNITDSDYDLIFTTYKGLDLTADQDVNPIVVFEPALDSLTDISETYSISAFKNTVYVAPSGITSHLQLVVVYSPGASGLVGFQRRTMYMVASDVNALEEDGITPTPNLAAILTQKGVDALANNNYVKMMDGTIVPQSEFLYGRDYNLGDIVELRNTTDIAQHARISEYIRAEDSTGETAYPTLSVIS